MKRFLGAILATAILTACAPTMRMGQPLTLDGTQYVVQLYFPGGYGAIAFDSKQAMEQFARMPGVSMERAAPIRTARSEVVVADKEATR